MPDSRTVKIRDTKDSFQPAAIVHQVAIIPRMERVEAIGLGPVDHGKHRKAIVGVNFSTKNVGLKRDRIAFFLDLKEAYGHIYRKLLRTNRRQVHDLLQQLGSEKRMLASIGLGRIGRYTQVHNRSLIHIGTQ